MPCVLGKHEAMSCHTLGMLWRGYDAPLSMSSGMELHKSVIRDASRRLKSEDIATANSEQTNR